MKPLSGITVVALEHAIAKRSAERAEVKALIEAVFDQLDAAEVIERLEAAGIANAQVNTMLVAPPARGAQTLGAGGHARRPAAVRPPTARVPGWCPRSTSGARPSAPPASSPTERAPCAHEKRRACPAFSFLRA